VALKDGDGLLFDNAHEQVSIESWPAHEDMAVANPSGLELLVVEGSFSQGGEQFLPQSWVRLPAGQALSAHTGPQGARVWLKKGALFQDKLCAF
jgi:hypothetical protein